MFWTHRRKYSTFFRGTSIWQLYRIRLAVLNRISSTWNILAGLGMDFTQLHHDAAQMLAEEKLTVVQIAEKLGIGERTLYNWKADEDFAALIEKKVNAYANKVMRQGIARKANRIATLQELKEKTLQVIAERGESSQVALSGAPIPGGSTGLVCRTVKSVNGRDVEEFTYDDAIVKTVLALHDQVAEELGQKISKIEHTGKDGGPLIIQDAKAKLLSKLVGGSSEALTGSGEASEDSEPK